MVFTMIATSFFSTLIHTLDNWDHWLFFKINHEWTNSFLDNTFPWWRDAETWAPFYLFLLVFMLMNFGKKSWIWIIALLITVTLTDQTSSTLFKFWFNRVRPCNDPFMIQYSRLLLSHCPTSPSFTSSHATNHFGAAVFMYQTLKKYFKNWGYLLFFWAATISYGQVYVGVHYPGDIIGGAILGSLIGLTTSTIYKRKFGIPELKLENSF